MRPPSVLTLPLTLLALTAPSSLAHHPHPAAAHQFSHLSILPLLPTPTLLAREIINAPPAAQPAVPTQVSPVMTLNIGGKPVLYTQKFSAVPDQWPTPEAGTIGLGTLQGEIGKTKTISKRGEEAVETGAVGRRSLNRLRCKTLECLEVLGEEGD
ncbi:hypothetical protein PRK78_006749 [Emydomyces testavorans]|uniref:Uncharacterized protein n=1 Tax=Emydomyces testavorans TaxID=2070801 RepID=A0AAF0IP08_9EURO|nr:hypothetical protein PRK78_006749 [Emydomyces testavorans]